MINPLIEANFLSVQHLYKSPFTRPPHPLKERVHQFSSKVVATIGHYEEKRDKFCDLNFGIKTHDYFEELGKK